MTPFPGTNDTPPARMATPEHLLLAGILERAVLDLCSTNNSPTNGGSARPVDRRQAHDWLFCDDAPETNDYGWSFRRICEELDLDPENVRVYARRVYEQAQARRAA